MASVDAVPNAETKTCRICGTGPPAYSASDRKAFAKFRIQAHYLQHRGFVRPGALDDAVLGLARQGVPVDWVHGACDAVCPPANSRVWAALGRRLAPLQVTLSGPLSGHLGAEPGMLAALRAVVRRPG